MHSLYFSLGILILIEGFKNWLEPLILVALNRISYQYTAFAGSVSTVCFMEYGWEKIFVLILSCGKEINYFPPP